MTQTTPETHAFAKAVITTLTFVVGVGIAAVFVNTNEETQPRSTNSPSRQFIELEKPVSVTTTEVFVGSS